MHRRNFSLAFLAAMGISPMLLADVDLTTIPTRDNVQLTIYNSEDVTMVREQRLLTIKKGVNRIQFAWAGTLIDPTSIDFRLLDHVDQVDLVDTTFPTGRNDALQWNIKSQMAGKLPVEIRYFTSGVTWEASYEGVANEDETKLNLKGYVKVSNSSGELYDNATVRLVVGNINLVEKISDLANRPPPRITTRTADERLKLRAEFDDALKKAESLSRFRAQASPPAVNAPAPLEEAKQVVKQGLSEYFLFAIDGREDIVNNQPKRMVSLDVADVPLEAMYKLSDRQGGKQFLKYYRFKNEELLNDDGSKKKLTGMENLGLSPLPNGNVRLFSQYANNDLAYVGGTSTKYVPIGDRIEVNVGVDSDITCARRQLDQKIENVVARQYERRLDDSYVLNYDLIDFDETFVYEEEIICGKSSLSKVEVERKFPANVYLFANDTKPEGWNGNEPGAYVDMRDVPGRVERVDQNHVKYFLDVNPGQKIKVKYAVTYKRRKVGPELNTEKRLKPIR